MVTVFLHCWQRTEQHQENLQEHRCTTSARPALYPGPQHTSSQPSGASREVPVCQQKRCHDSFWVSSFPRGRPYRYISDQLSPGSRSQDRDGRNQERVQGKGDLWQRGVSPGGHEGAGRFWILYESSEPKRQRVLTGLDTRGVLRGFQKVVNANVPLWRRQSVPWAQCQHAWTEASPSSRFSTRKIQRRRDTCTRLACCEGWPGGGRKSERGDRWKELRQRAPTAHLSPRLIVVEVHEWSTCRQALGSLWVVHKCLRERHAVGQVVTASWPLEPLDGKQKAS